MKAFGQDTSILHRLETYRAIFLNQLDVIRIRFHACTCSSLTRAVDSTWDSIPTEQSFCMHRNLSNYSDIILYGEGELRLRGRHLVNLLDLRTLVTTRGGAGARSTARGTTGGTVCLLHDRVGNALELLLLVVVLVDRALLGVVNPLDRLVNGLLKVVLVRGVELAGEGLFIERVTQVVRV